VNGATCSDGVASYTCTCVTGFDGDKCQHDKDDCLGVNCTEPNTEMGLDKDR
jgi:Notch-like protein